MEIQFSATQKIVLCCFFASQCVASIKFILPGRSTIKKLPFIGVEAVPSGLQRSPGVLLTVLIERTVYTGIC